MSLFASFSQYALGGTGDVCGSGIGLFAGSACPQLNKLDSQLWSEPKYWSPWTHRPYCQGSWCVHTNALVPCGQGISIITHRSGEQEAAAALAALSHDGDESDCAMQAAGLGVTSNGDIRREKVRMYEVRDSKGKGKGVFATRKIPRGSMIMVDHPIMLKLEPGINEYVLSDNQRSRLFDQAAIQLSDPSQVLGLAQHQGFAGSQAENAANYNSFQIPFGNETYSAVFPRVSLPNQMVTKDLVTDNLGGERYLARGRAVDKLAKFDDLAQEYHRLNHHDAEGSREALRILEQAMKINVVEPMLTSETPLLLQAAWTAYYGGHVATAKEYVEKIEEDMRARGFKDEGDEGSLEKIKGLLR
ncbi:hypothetical protein KVR01_012522 [Diaporthe batatas]|uniref:uncharacterized protein n=1 Tax=Diaporthe batatas TaxID=748121 RepID=UPI001D04EE0F|nr:uncharacterized protein KVR01_012522 [Diaporthe batatas]KAG8157480.1 hypothetical protein KVR01_012522 [Diaporthe batatas]